MDKIILSTNAKRLLQTRKKAASISITDKPVELYGAYWDGGSRNEWFSLNRNGKLTMLPMVGPAPYDNRPVPSFTPTDEICIVQMGCFCGKPATPHIYMNNASIWTEVLA